MAFLEGIKATDGFGDARTLDEGRDHGSSDGRWFIIGFQSGSSAALLGVPLKEADALARNPTVGAPGRTVREKLKQPVAVITAEVGSN